MSDDERAKDASAAAPPRADEEPSELAVGLAQLLRSLPPEAVRDVERLLAWRLTYVEPAVLREARLGLLLDMVCGQQGAMPRADEYEAARAERAARGETWPAASTLSRVFNGWARACRAAIRLVEVGCPAASRPSGAPALPSRQGAVHRDDGVAAIVRFHAEHDRWPNGSEYTRWRRDLRRRAGRLGLPIPPLPDLLQLRRTFGDFDRAVQVARLSSDRTK